MSVFVTRCRAGLGAMAQETRTEHYDRLLPPGTGTGTGRWNTIKRRLFDHMSVDWRGTGHPLSIDFVAPTTIRIRNHLATLSVRGWRLDVKMRKKERRALNTGLPITHIWLGTDVASAEVSAHFL
ncbi:hypothetical protein [Cryobacterium sp. 10C3]|uniref:hypothetical protein n=1 Tax=Cryobacterium sp. 10C3 TaxID=3048577 RepID=UPI002AB4F29D|nr:hypothetical protein [Cryobacterium sp. 10C3]MDY7557871.1 hypothetical protein [Cryobacterium sp. 10C3]